MAAAGILERVARPLLVSRTGITPDVLDGERFCDRRFGAKLGAVGGTNGPSWWARQVQTDARDIHVRLWAPISLAGNLFLKPQHFPPASQNGGG